MPLVVGVDAKGEMFSPLVFIYDGVDPGGAFRVWGYFDISTEKSGDLIRPEIRCK